MSKVSDIKLNKYIGLSIDECRIYYQLNTEIRPETFPKNEIYLHGFIFEVWGMIADYGETEKWHKDDEVNLMLSGVAYFDGIRHINFGQASSFGEPDTSKNEYNPGYFNYPDILLFSNIFQELHKLEILYCLECHK